MGSGEKDKLASLVSLVPNQCTSSRSLAYNQVVILTGSIGSCVLG